MSSAVIERDVVVSFLREQRDNYHDLHSDSDDRVGRAYAMGRYHAYCDVLAWWFSKEHECTQDTDTEQPGDRNVE